jgi:hypothetical protein
MQMDYFPNAFHKLFGQKLTELKNEQNILAEAGGGGELPTRFAKATHNTGFADVIENKNETLEWDNLTMNASENFCEGVPQPGERGFRRLKINEDGKYYIRCRLRMDRTSENPTGRMEFDIQVVKNLTTVIAPLTGGEIIGESSSFWSQTSGDVQYTTAAMHQSAELRTIADLVVGDTLSVVFFGSAIESAEVRRSAGDSSSLELLYLGPS